jgi:RNA polymerase sigma-70 factor (ECF subfamily)
VGDIDAYESELRPLLSEAAGYALSLLRNKQDAEDAVQQAALRAWERLDQYQTSRPFKGWWFAILKNCCVDILRARNAPDTYPLDGVDPPAAGEPDAFEWEGLERALQRLSPAHAEILRLKYYGGLSYAEIAEALDIPKGTVMSRLHLARKALTQRLSEERP